MGHRPYTLLAFELAVASCTPLVAFVPFVPFVAIAFELAVAMYPARG